MDLWIRSQDKTMLVKVEEIILRDDNTLFRNAPAFTILGKYKTKERALEVLDEIQNVIYMNKLFNANVNAFKLSLGELKMNEAEMNNLLKKISVYEMPEE